MKCNRIMVLMVLAAVVLTSAVWGAEFRRQPRKATDGPFGRIIGQLERRALPGDAPEMVEAVVPPAPKANGGLHVLVASSDNYPTGLANFLMAQPDISAVDHFDCRIALPTLGYLQGYDAVIAFSDNYWYDRVAMGDLLADFVDAGGKLILAVFDWADDNGWALSGRIITGGYSPFMNLGNDNLYTWADLGAFNASHPVMAGVTAASDDYRDDVILSPGAGLIAAWDDGVPFVAEKNCVIAVNSYLGYYHVFTGDVFRVIYNAVVYVASGCSAYQDYVFMDDYGRAMLCVNADGTFLFRVLENGGAEFEGQAELNWRAGVMYMISPRELPWSLYLVYDSTNHRAHAYYWNPPQNVRSFIYDLNTLDNPASCF